MNKLIIILITLCTLSVTLLAEEETKLVMADTRSSDVRNTNLSETIDKYFIWTIPSTCIINSETTELVVTVNEAHLATNETLKISVSGFDNDGKAHLANEDEEKSSELTIKQNGVPLDRINTILTVTSSNFDSENPESKSAAITIERQRNKFQFAGSYNANLEFTATITDQ